MFIPRPVFSIVKIADTENSRYAMSGIHVERDAVGNSVAVATDGRSLIATTWSKDTGSHHLSIGKPVDNFEAVISAEAIKTAVKGHKMRKAEIENDPTQAGFVVDEEKGSIIAETHVSKNETCDAFVDGRFPKWRDVVRDHSGGSAIKVDAKKLADLIALVGSLSEDGAVTISFDAQDPGSNAVKVSGRNIEHCQTIGVVMPLTGSQVVDEMPIDKEVKADEAKADEAKADEAKADEAKADKAKADKAKAAKAADWLIDEAAKAKADEAAKAKADEAAKEARKAAKAAKEVLAANEAAKAAKAKAKAAKAAKEAKEAAKAAKEVLAANIAANRAANEAQAKAAKAADEAAKAKAKADEAVYLICQSQTFCDVTR